MHIDSAHNQRTFARVVALAWSSDSFKAALLQDPARVLREHGMDLPEGTSIALHDEGAAPVDGDATLHLALPARPDDLADVPIVSQTSSAYACGSRASFAEDAVHLTLPARPGDLTDVPIVSQTSSAYVCGSRASFAEDAVHLTLPARPVDLTDVPIVSQTSSAYICGSRASFADDAVHHAVSA